MTIAIFLYRSQRHPKMLAGVTSEEAVKESRKKTGTRLAWLDPDTSRDAAELIDIIDWMFQFGMKASDIIHELDRARQLDESFKAGITLRRQIRKKA